MKYRKKSIIVEAFQMTVERLWDTSDWPWWLLEAWRLEMSQTGAIYRNGNQSKLFINTLEGTHQVTFGDYIIQGIKGELYPCKPDIFKANYDAL